MAVEAQCPDCRNVFSSFVEAIDCRRMAIEFCTIAQTFKVAPEVDDLLAHVKAGEPAGGLR